VVASVGGGKDSEAVLSVMLEAALATVDDPRLHWCIVAGPLIRQAQWEDVTAMIGNRPITLLRYVPRLIDLIRECNLFVGSCGYNLAAEVAATGTSAVLIPISCPDEQEQTIRGRVFQERGICRTLELGSGAAQQLAAYVRERIQQADSMGGRRPVVQVKGADIVAQRIACDWEALQDGVALDADSQTEGAVRPNRRHSEP
jgi:predicted glycosyltransferase